MGMDFWGPSMSAVTKAVAVILILKYSLVQIV
jgi:hypothetical protein